MPPTCRTRTNWNASSLKALATTTSLTSDTTPDVIRRLQAAWCAVHPRPFPAMVRRLQELLGHPPPKEEGSIF